MLNYRALTLLVMVATIVVTVMLYIKTPKGYFPQDDTGLIFGGTQASTDISFEAMYELQQKARRDRAAPIRRSRTSARRSAPRAAAPRSTAAAVHQPEAAGGARRRSTAQAVANRLRPKTRRHRRHARVHVPGAGHARRRPRRATRTTSSRCGAPTSTSCCNGRRAWSPSCRRVPGLIDVSTDREQGGLQANVVDRPGRGLAPRRARPGHRQRAQQRLRAAADLDHLHPAQPVPRHPRGRSAIPARPVRSRRASTCRGANGTQVPLTAVTQDRARAVAAGRQPPGPVSRRSPSASASAET